MSNLYSFGSPTVTATLWGLCLLSIATWSITLFKLWKQVDAEKRNRAFSQVFWSAPNWRAANEVIANSDGDLAQLGRAAHTELRSLEVAQGAIQHLGTPQDVVQRALRQQIQNLQRYHERGLAELATIGSTAPFVGLFGTVWGIMHALRDIGTSGAATLDVVAGPIGEALITTAIGIATAVPAVLAYNYFLRRLRVRVTEFENFAHDYMRLATTQHFKP